MADRALKRGALLAAAAAVLAVAQPAKAQVSIASEVNAGELDVPINKSQVLRADRPYAKALIGNPDIADIVPITDRSVYVLGKKNGTTRVTAYAEGKKLIGVFDVEVIYDTSLLQHEIRRRFPHATWSSRSSRMPSARRAFLRRAPATSRRRCGDRRRSMPP